VLEGRRLLDITENIDEVAIMVLEQQRRTGMVERSDFFRRVYAIVAQIPRGRVTTYGHIARSLGIGSAARMVGYALNALARQQQWDLPCHRVVNRRGELSGRRYFPTPTWMETMLRQEGVRFIEENRVDLERHLWIPPPLSL